MRNIFLLFAILLGLISIGQNTESNIASRNTFLNDLRTGLQKELPNNRTINIVFHGHGVPAG